jgi:(1->4)-alpha-D-glucan 1-alpha-D-glucosylmutase
LLAELLTDWQRGTGKLFVTHALLQLRGELPELFASSDYSPLQVEGEHRDHVLAFQRGTRQHCIIVVVTRWLAKLMKGEIAPPVGEVWGDTSIKVPPFASVQYREVFSDQPIELDPSAGEIPVRQLLESFPAAVLVGTLP